MTRASPVSSRVPWTFFITVAAGLALLLALRLIPAPVFSGAAPTTMCNGVEIAFESKMRAIENRPPVDVMLFGNSRIIAVGAQELGLPESRVFNTGSGGTSFRQSVALLEEIARIDKLPRVAVMSFDHLSLVYAQLDADWPPPPRRWRLVAGDVIALADAPYRVGSDIRAFFKNQIIGDIDRVARLVNLRYLQNRVQALLGRSSGPCLTTYREDGSRPWPARFTADNDGRPLPVWQGQDLRYPLLEHDLDRLAALQARGTWVVIYESPLLPAMAAVVEPLLGDEARRQRRRLFEGCRARRLACFAAPSLAGSAEDGYWSDTNHAPPPALGRFIAGLIRPILDATDSPR